MNFFSYPPPPPTPLKPTYVHLTPIFSSNPTLNHIWNSHRDAWCIINNLFQVSLSIINPTTQSPPRAILHNRNSKIEYDIFIFNSYFYFRMVPRLLVYCNIHHSWHPCGWSSRSSTDPRTWCRGGKRSWQLSSSSLCY